MKRRSNYWIGFIAGLCVWGLLIFLRRTGVIVRYGSFDYALVIGTVVLIFVSLPRIVSSAKKEAIPAKKGDWIGYTVILIFLLAVVGIGYVALR
jgi:hypothetical protein